MARSLGLAAVVFALALGAAQATAQASAQASADTLAAVQARGALQCGVVEGVTGFSTLSDRGEWSGLDVDLCRALATAIFNDPAKVKFVPLANKDRFAALQSGDIDVLARNAAWTISRDIVLGLEFPAITYFDQQGFLVRKSIKVNSALELSGATVCVRSGTTAELNTVDFFQSRNMPAEIVGCASTAELRRTYDTGRCQAMSNDISSLRADQQTLTSPSDHVLLPEIIGKMAQGPAVRSADEQWIKIVRWVHYAMVAAEELGVTSKNVDDMLRSTNPETRRLLGLDGSYGEQLGLTKDWAARVIKRVGNYGEVFERNVGKDSRLALPRGMNALASKGGLQYAPPIR